MTTPSPPTPTPTPPHLSPYDTATIFQHLTFSYVLPLISQSHNPSTPLTPRSLPPLPAIDSPSLLTSKLAAAFNSSSSSSSSKSLPRAIYKTFTLTFFQTLTLVILEHATMLLQPLLLSSLLSHISSPFPPLSTGISLSLLMLLTSLLQAIFHHRLYYLTMRTGWNLRTSLTAMVHSKLLRLSATSSSSTSSTALNLISTDVFRFDNFAPFFWYYFTGPIDFAIIVYLLSLRVTLFPALSGAFIVVLQAAFQLRFGALIGRCRTRTATLTDERLGSLKEAVTGIETVKAYGWEGVFGRIITGLRSEEHGSILKSQIIKGR